MAVAGVAAAVVVAQVGFEEVVSVTVEELVDETVFWEGFEGS